MNYPALSWIIGLRVFMGILLMDDIKVKDICSLSTAKQYRIQQHYKYRSILTTQSVEFLEILFSFDFKYQHTITEKYQELL